MYPTESIAEGALISAWITYTYTAGNGPVAVYLCEECGSYHLTSKGTMNKRLAELLANGEIRKQKETGAWLHKMSRRNKF